MVTFVFEVTSKSTNVIIDDYWPDPLTGAMIEYGPKSATATWNLGQACGDCSAQPDASLIFNGTWHDGTFFPLTDESPPPLTAMISFSGKNQLINKGYDSRTNRYHQEQPSTL